MNEKAVVLEVKDKVVKLTPLPNEGCASCGGDCKTKHKIFTLFNDQALSLKAGDLVEIQVTFGAKALQALLSLFLPFLFALAGFFIGKNISLRAEAFLPITFFFLSCLAVFLLSRKKKLPGKIKIIGVL